MKRAGKVGRDASLRWPRSWADDADRRQELRRRSRSTARSHTLIVERRLTPQQSDLIRAGTARRKAWSRWLSRLIRCASIRTPAARPDTTLASQLLGFVTDDGQGRYGIEQASQDLLAGSGGPTANAAGQRTACRPTGGSVQLTIDASLQLRTREGALRGLGRRPGATA